MSNDQATHDQAAPESRRTKSARRWKTASCVAGVIVLADMALQFIIDFLAFALIGWNNTADSQVFPQEWQAVSTMFSLTLPMTITLVPCLAGCAGMWAYRQWQATVERYGDLAGTMLKIQIALRTRPQLRQLARALRRDS